MKELQTGGKIVQQLTSGGAVEVNKATGGAERISARELDVSPDTNSAELVGGVADRILSERRAAKKKAVKRANAEIFERVQKTPHTSRLRFTDAEREDPAMSKVIRKSDQTADRYEAARAKIPKEKVLSVERVLDKPTGEAKTRLSFRERDKPPNGRLSHTLDRPGREAALLIHNEVRKSEGDNSGIQAAHFAERATEGAARKIGDGYRRLKLQPHRAALRAEEKAIKVNVDALYERSLRLNPELADASILKKAAHKRKIKREYARSFRQGNFERVKKAAKKAGKTAEKTVQFAKKHWKGLFMFGGALGLLILLVAGIGSCASMFTGGINAIVGTSYTAENPDITGADGDYAALESNLAARITRIESDYPGYDEYRFSLDEIGHDPFELASYLTAKYNGYTRAQIQAELTALFAQQYTLTLSPITEVRYRTETRTDSYTYTDPETGETYTEDYTYTVEVPYNYYILNVTLKNKSLGAVALSNLTSEQAEMYAVYMETKGNKPELFADNPYVNRGEYTDYDIPPEALTDTTFAAMIQEAEKYLGYPYVWGGSSPSTSFDCSGFACWVINQSGVGSVGRTTASGLFKHCAIIPPSEARPGDLIFFQGTYDSAGPASHVGIYVGNGMMIHCGNPISYTSVTKKYWTDHFLAYGRLP